MQVQRMAVGMVFVVGLLAAGCGTDGGSTDESTSSGGGGGSDAGMVDQGADGGGNGSSSSSGGNGSSSSGGGGNGSSSGGGNLDGGAGGTSSSSSSSSTGGTSGGQPDASMGGMPDAAGPVDAGPPLLTLSEQEPNDGPSVAQTQMLGSFTDWQDIALSGQLSTGGNNGQSYTGDYDIFAFSFTRAGTWSAQVDWTGGANVDAYLYSETGNVLTFSADTTRPINLTFNVSATTYILALYSQDQPASWTVQWRFRPSTGGTSGGLMCPQLSQGLVSGGCAIQPNEPAHGAQIAFPYQFGWVSNGGCSTPYRLIIYGNPPSAQNAVSWTISTDPPNQPAATQWVQAGDLAQLTSDDGRYHWEVGNHSGEAFSASHTFTLSGGPACQ